MPMVFGSALTVATFVVVVVVARFNSWDQFFFTFFKLPKFRFRGVRFRG